MFFSKQLKNINIDLKEQFQMCYAITFKSTPQIKTIKTSQYKLEIIEINHFMKNDYLTKLPIKQQVNCRHH